MARIRTLLIATVALALAAVECSDALARVSARRMPELAAHFPLTNGFARSRWASQALARAYKGEPPQLRMPPAERRRWSAVVRSSYRQEPLNQAALRTWALLVEADGQERQARQLMRASAGLSGRDLPTNLWLGRDYAQLGQIETALSFYDHALRTSAEAQGAILPVILDNLKQDALVEPVSELLLKRPPWQDVFWGYAIRSRDSLPNVARVRTALLKAGVPVDRQYDRVLLFELANARHFASGRDLSRLVQQREAGPLLNNAEFRQAPDLVPFDWELSLSSFLTPEIVPREGVLRVSTFADGSGRVARQLVALPGQVYTLDMKAREWDSLDRNALYVRLDCAEAGPVTSSRPIYLDRPNMRQAFTKPQPGCSYYWFGLYAAAQPQERDNVVTLDRLAIIPGAR